MWTRLALRTCRDLPTFASGVLGLQPYLSYLHSAGVGWSDSSLLLLKANLASYSAHTRSSITYVRLAWVWACSCTVIQWWKDKASKLTQASRAEAGHGTSFLTVSSETPSRASAPRGPGYCPAQTCVAKCHACLPSCLSPQLWSAALHHARWTAGQSLGSRSHIHPLKRSFLLLLTDLFC